MNRFLGWLLDYGSLLWFGMAALLALMLSMVAAMLLIKIAGSAIVGVLMVTGAR